MSLNGITHVLAQINISKNEVDIPMDANTTDALSDGLQLFFGISGAVALIMITIAGLQYVISQGDPQKTVKAKNTILYALIGLVVSIFAFSIVGFVVENI